MHLIIKHSHMIWADVSDGAQIKVTLAISSSNNRFVSIHLDELGYVDLNVLERIRFVLNQVETWIKEGKVEGYVFE